MADFTRERRRLRARKEGAVIGQIIDDVMAADGNMDARDRRRFVEAQWRIYVRREHGDEYRVFMDGAGMERDDA